MGKIVGSILVIVAIIALILFIFIFFPKCYGKDFGEFIVDFWEVFGIIIATAFLGIIFIIQGI